MGNLDGSSDLLFLVRLGVVARLAAERHGLGVLGVRENAMRTLTGQLGEPGLMQIGDQFSHLSRHVRDCGRPTGREAPNKGDEHIRYFFEKSLAKCE